MDNKVESTLKLISSVTSGSITSLIEIEKRLEQIKALGRYPEVSCSFTTTHLNDLVDNYVLTEISHRALIETLTILANALVLNQDLLSSWTVPHPVMSKVLNECLRTEMGPRDDYLFLRLIFLFTFRGQPYDEEIVKTSLTICVAKFSKAASEPSLLQRDGAELLALIECMKLTFNLLHHDNYHDTASWINGDMPRNLLKIFYNIHHQNPQQSASSILQHVSNILLCIPVSMWLYDNDDSMIAITKILEFIENLINPTSTTTRDDRYISPPLSLLHCIVADLFDNTNPKYDKLRQLMLNRILPTDRDREQSLGKSDSLSSYMLQVTIDPILRTSRNIIFDIFWQLSHEDPDEFIKNIGLGFASSFLASQGIAIPESLSADDGNYSLTSTSSKDINRLINPITGQFLDSQAEEKMDNEMSEDEKLREAERMFVLFERVKSNNFLKVVNPVETAARQAKLQEIND